jgi:hypothetical protein
MENQSPNYSPVELAAELFNAYSATKRGLLTFNRIQQQALYKLAAKYGKDAVIEAYLAYVPTARAKVSRIPYDFVECCEALILSERLKQPTVAVGNERN